MPWSVGQIKYFYRPRLVSVGYYRNTTYTSHPLGIYLDSSDRLHVAAYGDDRYTILDVSDPTSPSLIGSVKDATYLQEANGIQVQGTTAFIQGYAGRRFTPIDISTASSPSVTTSGSLTLSGLGGAIYKLSSSYLLAGVSSGSASVIDISTPSAPSDTGTTLGTNAYGQNGMGTDAFGGYLWGRDTGGSSDKIDISTPSAPSISVAYTNDAIAYDTSYYATADIDDTTIDVYNTSDTLVATTSTLGYTNSNIGVLVAFEPSTGAVVFMKTISTTQRAYIPGYISAYDSEITWGDPTYGTYVGGSSFTGGGEQIFKYPYLYSAWRYDNSIEIFEWLP